MLHQGYTKPVGDASPAPDRVTASILRGAARVLGLPLDVVQKLPPALLARLAEERLPRLLRERAVLDRRIDSLADLQDWARERMREGGAHAG